MQIQCKSCLAITNLPPGADPHAYNWCNCCTSDHHHGQRAAACPGNGGVGHEGAPCNHPNPSACTVVTPPGEECPGGHCGLGVDGCTVCRPVIHLGVGGDMMGTGGNQ